MAKKEPRGFFGRKFDELGNALERGFDAFDEGPAEKVSQVLSGKTGDILEKATDYIPQVMAALGTTGVAGWEIGALTTKVAHEVVKKIMPNAKPSQVDKFADKLINAGAFAGTVKLVADRISGGNAEKSNPQSQLGQMVNQLSPNEYPLQTASNNISNFSQGLGLNNKSEISPEKSKLLNYWNELSPENKQLAISKIPGLLQTLGAIAEVGVGSYMNGQNPWNYLYENPNKINRVDKYNPEYQKAIDEFRLKRLNQYDKDVEDYNKKYPIGRAEPHIPQGNYEQKPNPQSSNYGIPSVDSISNTLRNNPGLRSALGGLIGTGIGHLGTGSSSGLGSMLGSGLGGYFGNTYDQFRR